MTVVSPFNDCIVRDLAIFRFNDSSFSARLSSSIRASEKAEALMSTDKMPCRPPPCKAYEAHSALDETKGTEKGAARQPTRIAPILDAILIGLRAVRAAGQTCYSSRQGTRV